MWVKYEIQRDTYTNWQCKSSRVGAVKDVACIVRVGCPQGMVPQVRTFS